MADDRIKVCVPDQKEIFEVWIRERGGVKVWKNVNLSNPNAGNMFTPAKTREGLDFLKPHWAYEFDKIVTDIKRFRFVKEMIEVKRFHVAVRMGSQGLNMKLTDASSRKLNNVLAKIEKQKHVQPAYQFDYDTQEAVISIPIFED